MKIPVFNKYLTKLDLSNLGLTELPSDIYKCTNLKKLNLSHNKLRGLPKELSKFKYLKNLDVSHNEISIIYAKIFDLKNLEVFILNNNKLKKIPGQIELLKKLKKLSIANNSLVELSDMVYRLQDLESLDLTNNNFKEFPYGILSLTKLTHLWLGKNVFLDFPTNGIIKELPLLKYLYCFSSVRDSINSVDNDYSTLQQIKGNCISALNILDRNSIPNSEMIKPASQKGIKEAPEPIVTNSPKKPIGKHIFISYSHHDTEYKNEIEISLKGLKHLGCEFEFWVDTQLEGGDLWREEIDKAIQKASVAINIVSRYYLASDFINEVEIPALLQKAENEGTLILNVIAKKCNFQNTVLEKFQAINNPSRPIQDETPAGQQAIYATLEKRIMKLFN